MPLGHGGSAPGWRSGKGLSEEARVSEESCRFRRAESLCRETVDSLNGTYSSDGSDSLFCPALRCREE